MKISDIGLVFAALMLLVSQSFAMPVMPCQMMDMSDEHMSHPAMQQEMDHSMHVMASAEVESESAMLCCDTQCECPVSLGASLGALIDTETSLLPAFQHAGRSYVESLTAPYLPAAFKPPISA